MRLVLVLGGLSVCTATISGSNGNDPDDVKIVAGQMITCARWDSLLIAGASDADGPPAEVGEADKLFLCMLIGHDDILDLHWDSEGAQGAGAGNEEQMLFVE